MAEPTITVSRVRSNRFTTRQVYDALQIVPRINDANIFRVVCADGSTEVFAIDTDTPGVHYGGNIAFATDNANDIGAAASGRPRDVYVGRDLKLNNGQLVIDRPNTGIANCLRFATAGSVIWGMGLDITLTTNDLVLAYRPDVADMFRVSTTGRFVMGPSVDSPVNFLPAASLYVITATETWDAVHGFAPLGSAFMCASTSSIGYSADAKESTGWDAVRITKTGTAACGYAAFISTVVNHRDWRLGMDANDALGLFYGQNASAAAPGSQFITVGITGNLGLGANATAVPVPVTVYRDGVNISGDYYATAYFHNAANNKGLDIGYLNSDIVAVLASSAHMAFWTNNGSAWGERVRITNTGSVLVGTVTDAMTAAGSLAVAKDLAHRGTLAGFFNKAPAAQPTKAANNNWAAISDVTAALAALGLIDAA